MTERTAIVTSRGSGIGLAIVEKFIAAVDRDEAELNAVKKNRRLV